ncbi:MAG: hypothetical protein ACM3ML_27830 [Micromonosporaceae bacterium]
MRWILGSSLRFGRLVVVDARPVRDRLDIRARYEPVRRAAGSWRRAGLMLAALPLSAVGGVLTAPLVGGPWNAASLAGLFAILALAIRASVLLGRRIHVKEEASTASGRAEANGPGKPPGLKPAA